MNLKKSTRKDKACERFNSQLINYLLSHVLESISFSILVYGGFKVESFIFHIFFDGEIYSFYFNNIASFLTFSFFTFILLLHVFSGFVYLSGMTYHHITNEEWIKDFSQKIKKYKDRE